MIPSLCEIIGRATLLQRQTIAVTLTGDFFTKVGYNAYYLYIK